MTKEAYFEMCEALGTEPIDSEIPIEYNDLLLEVQEALGIYSKLKDDWDTMNGHYLGKSYSGIGDIFNILEIAKEDRRTMFDLIGIIDTYRAKSIKAQQPAAKKPA
jgi:hypothetical protein